MIERVIYTEEAEVFYELIQNSIVIYSVFHSSQDPEKWRARLKDET